MTRLLLRQGYAEAGRVLQRANQGAADLAVDLSDALGGTGAMAGDSSFATEFAVSYDTAAADLVGGIDEAVSAIAGLGQLCWASHANHHHADRASRIRARHLTPLLTAGIPGFGGPTSWFTSDSPSPPASAGGDLSSLPGWAAGVLGGLEGEFWPDADLDRLRRAAEAWYATDLRLAELRNLVRHAAGQVHLDLSPEVDLAADALRRLGDALDDLGAGAGRLAATCAAYAEEVAARREQTLDLIRDFLLETAVLTAAGILLTAVTSGTSNLATAAAVTARSAKLADDLRDVLRILQDAAAAHAAAMAGTATALNGSRHTLTTMGRARPLLMEADTPATRGVRGARGARGAGGAGRRSILEESEARGGHTIRDHLGKTKDELLEQLLRSDKGRSSSFVDADALERGRLALVEHRADDISTWLASGKNQLRLRAPCGGDLGIVVTPEGDVLAPNRLLAVLRRDPTMPDGYRFLTLHLESKA